MQFPPILRSRSLFVCLFIFAVANCAAQGGPAKTQPKTGLEALDKYPGIVPELGKFIGNLQHNVQFPPPRSASRLLPLLPASTNIYIALPNYGEAAGQALSTFHRQLTESPALRDFWTHGEVAKDAPKIEDALYRFSRLSEYLGDEIVISGAVEEKQPKLLIVAAIRQPGLKQALQDTIQQLSGKSKPPVRILEPQELLGVRPGSPDLLVLIRPDFAVAAPDIVTLRSFNQSLDHAAGDFPSTPFAQRILQAYNGGVTTVGALDFQGILAKVQAPSPQAGAILQATGFSELQYLVWDHKEIAGRAMSESELSFTGPRHGVAAWLAAPTRLGSLDFVSPNAIMAASFVLKNPGDIFGQLLGFAGAQNPNFAGQLATSEEALGISVKNDIFAQLGGEITVEVDSVEPPQPTWKVLFRMNDYPRFEHALNLLMSSAHLLPRRFDDAGLTYYVVQNPSAPNTSVAYAYRDGYLVLASSADAVKQAVHLHGSGKSLAASAKFQAALPPGHDSGLSGLIYQDSAAMGALQIRRILPGLASSMPALPSDTAPSVVVLYGDETAIREASTNSAFDAGAVLVVAAVAIPNLLRSRIAANEAAAVGKLRTVITAQVTYSASYPDRGFAPDLSSLGPDPAGSTSASAEHAALLDAGFAGSNCTAANSCEHSGYRFLVKALCAFQSCQDYVAVATPVDTNTGSRNFCSTSDGVIRFKLGAPSTAIVTAKECHGWQVLK